MKDFVHIHSHTNLGSMLDALVGVDDLFNRAKELGQPALAITDHGTLAAHYDAFFASKKTGVKFIPGCEMYFVNNYGIINEGEKGRKKTEKRKHLVLLAPNHRAYQNLLKMNYIGFQNQVFVIGRSFPRVNWTDLKKYSDGLICTSACANGPISRAIMDNDNLDKAMEIAIELNSIFKDRFFIEIQPHLLKDGDLDQHKLNETLIYIAKKQGIPIVVGTDVHYLTKESQVYHDVLLAVKDKKPVDDPTRHRYGIDEFYMKDGDEVYNFLSKHYGVEIAEEAVNNTLKIADMCEEPNYLEPKGNHLPNFDLKNEEDYDEFLQWKEKAKMSKTIKEDAAFMRFRCIKGFKEKYSHLPKEKRKEYWKRVLKELKVLEGNDFSSYMLVVTDFIRWAKNNHITVGPGRGSAAGCLVAYLLGIHTVDPMEYGLLFERFQNEYKKDLPDIDTDFSSAGRDLVKEYCRNKYGKENCAIISNFNTYTPKNVIPDLVKSMRNVMPGLIKPGQHYVGVSDAIKAEIPEEDSNGKKVKTLEKALEISKGLRSFAEKSPELMKYAKNLVGLPKEYGSHAAGVIIANQPIINVAPLRVDKNGQTAVQYEKNRCESLGLIKMDFLAISTLDIMDETLKNIKRLEIDGPKTLEEIPLDDEETFEMIKKGHTKCVFQLGKSGMMVSLCKLIKPENIVDIAIVNALGRPSSSKEERIDFAKRKFGQREISYLQPCLENSLKDTFGIGIFEEQLMGIAQDVAGWDLSKADGLRKLTKLKGKKPELALKLETEFIEGSMEKHNLTYEEATEIWTKVVAPFAGYGFNKSHAVSYSILSYYSAYLKYHFPSCFLAAYLKIRTDRGGVNKDDEIATAKQECRRMNVKIIPPDINKSGENYEVLDKDTIVMGFAAIKGMGDKAVENVVENQPFNSFLDFLANSNARVVNKSKLEVLAKAGCFDSFKHSRKAIFEEGKEIRDKMKVFLRKKAEDGYDTDMALEQFSFNLSKEEWDRPQLLQNEQDVLGEIVSGDIKEMFPGFFTGYRATPISRLKTLPDRHNIAVEFIVMSLLREFKIKSGRYMGQKMIKYRVSDIWGAETELTVWPTEYETAKKFMLEGRPVRAQCQVSEFNNVKTLMLRSIEKVYQGGIFVEKK